jgi:UDP-N-acetylmuramyl pentapeptide synthase
MNELGDVSEFEHTRIGEYCDPNQLDYVITLGPDANKYLLQQRRVAAVKWPSSLAPMMPANL